MRLVLYWIIAWIVIAALIKALAGPVEPYGQDLRDQTGETPCLSYGVC